MNPNFKRKTNNRRTNEQLDNLIFEWIKNNNCKDVYKLNKLSQDTGIACKTLKRRLPAVFDKIMNKRI